MKFICPKCELEMSVEIGRHHYIESGLSNVYVDNIKIYRCPCGESLPSIYRVGMLNDLIAKEVLSKPSFLKGNEIKFLRKNLHLPAKSFAEKIDVAITTYSKWENDKQNHDKQNDRLIRLMYIALKGLKQTDTLTILASISKGFGAHHPDSFIVVKKIEDTYVVFREEAVSGTLNPCVLFERSGYAMAAPTINIFKQTASGEITGIESFVFDQGRQFQATSSSYGVQ